MLDRPGTLDELCPSLADAGSGSGDEAVVRWATALLLALHRGELDGADHGLGGLPGHS